MVLIGSAILPHGSMILDPTMDDIPPGVDELHTAAKYVGDYVRDHEPDIIVLATPHGINLSDSIGIYSSRIGTGSAEWNDYWKEYKVSVNFHDDFAFEIFNHLQVLLNTNHQQGGRNSVVECPLRMRKVTGSNPVASNNIFFYCLLFLLYTKMNIVAFLISVVIAFFISFVDRKSE